MWYGVPPISSLLKNTGLFCRIASLLKGSFAKETCNFKEPTNRSHRIYAVFIIYVVCSSALLPYICSTTPIYLGVLGAI